MTTAPAVIAAAARQAGLTPTELIYGRRSANNRVARVRQRAMYVLRELRPDLSFPTIATSFGARDHTTVIHACRRVPERMQESSEEARLVASLTEAVASAPKRRIYSTILDLKIAELEAQLVELKAERAQLQRPVTQ